MCGDESSHEHTLKAFVAGRVSLTQLQEELKGVAEIRFPDTDERDLHLYGELPQVRFRPRDVERMLKRYLKGTTSARDVSDWAAALRLLDCFDVHQDVGDSDAVWDVVDQLAGPDAWGLLTVERALVMMRLLDEAAA